MLRKVLVLAVFAGLLSGCSAPEDTVSISGVVWSAPETGSYVELSPLHYKFSPKRRLPVAADENGKFSVDIVFQAEDDLGWLVIGDFSTPILLRHGSKLKISQSSETPETFQISGYDNDWQALFNAYITEDRRMMNAIRNERPQFRAGKVEETVQLYKTRIHLAKSHLSDSPFGYYIHKSIGEYLVVRLKALDYTLPANPVTADSIRSQILAEAASFDFFSFTSLKAQRAGIRDFTDAYASSFGVRDSLEAKLQQKLMQYDIKRLGYGRMNAARQFIVDGIIDPRAKAWSEMHLVLERLSEAPFAVAEESFSKFKTAFSTYPEYVSLAETLYQDIRKVSPGSQAPSFQYPDSTGKMIGLEQFAGKYVLLDFWAQWCSPCLEEFPHMNRLYGEFNRNELEIIAISLDSDREVWLQSIRTHKNPWVQIWGGKDFENELFKTYRGGGIPFYILIGPDGKILRYNDVRPSFNLEEVMNVALGRKFASRGVF